MADADVLRDDWEVPHPQRLSPQSRDFAEVIARHDASMRAGLPTYVDPLSGFSVFTAGFLARRGDCCDSGCRHCPFVAADPSSPGRTRSH